LLLIAPSAAWPRPRQAALLDRMPIQAEIELGRSRIW